MEPKIKTNLMVYVAAGQPPCKVIAMDEGTQYEHEFVTQRIDQVQKNHIHVAFETDGFSAYTTFIITPELIKAIMEESDNPVVIAAIEGLNKRLNRFKSALESIQAL